MPKTITAVQEIPFRLEVNDRSVDAWSCTPAHLEALAVGRLLSLGYVTGANDVLGIDVVREDGTAAANVRLPAGAVDRGDRERRLLEEHACGLLHYVRFAPEAIQRTEPVAQLPEPARFAELFRELYAAAERYQATGGLHTAALSDGRRVHLQVEEVGRHNAVDKVIGRAALDGRDRRPLGLVTTARISAAIAYKAARAHLSWIASRSVPTTLAVRIAETGGLPIVARAARSEPRVFPPPETPE